MKLKELEVMKLLTEVLNSRLEEVEFYRTQPLTKVERDALAKGWIKEALFPSQPRPKDKALKVAK